MAIQRRRSHRAVPALILAVVALLAALLTTAAPAYAAASGSKRTSVAHVQDNAALTLHKAHETNLAQAVFPNQIVFGWFNKISTDTSGEFSLNSVPSQISLISIFDLNGMPQYDHNTAWWSAVTPQVDNLHAKGQKVLYEIWLNRAVNGSNGSPVYPQTAAGYAAMTQELYNEVTALHLDGVEVDIESGITLDNGGAQDIAVMNALSQDFGPKSTTGKILTMDTNEQGTSQPFNSTSGNYNYLIEQEYWKTSSQLTTDWATYAPYISPSQYIVTVDFEDGSGWSTQYGNPSEFANYASWNPVQGTKGGVGAYGINYDYANCPAYHNVLSAYQTISGVTPPPYAGGLNVNAIYTDGSTFSSSGGIDGQGSAYSSNLLGSSQTWNGHTVTVGPANAADAWACQTVSVSTTNKYNEINVLATGLNGNQTGQAFTVNYSDGTSITITQSVSDWFTPQHYAGETTVSSMAYRDLSNGTKDNRTFNLYGYSFTIDGTKTVQSVTTPNTRNVVMLGYSLDNSTALVSQSVSLTSAFNREGIVTDGTTFSSTGGIDGVGYALSSNLLGSATTYNSVIYNYGTANANNDVSAAGQVITLPAGQYSTLRMMATAVNGNQTSQAFKVTYTDGMSATFTQSLSDWYSPQNYAGELTAVSMGYRDTSSGTKDNRTFHLYNYSFALDKTKSVQSVTLPTNANVEVVSMALVS